MVNAEQQYYVIGMNAPNAFAGAIVNHSEHKVERWKMTYSRHCGEQLPRAAVVRRLRAWLRWGGEG
jgi:hypothetical protein